MRLPTHNTLGEANLLAVVHEKQIPLFERPSYFPHFSTCDIFMPETKTVSQRILLILALLGGVSENDLQQCFQTFPERWNAVYIL
jgi:hypothetical protein